MESGAMKAQVWCHRIFHIQATCGLTEKELRETVSKLVQRFVDDKNNTLSKPVKFAAGYNRRGGEETKGKILQESLEVMDQCLLLNYSKCFATVADAVKDIVPDSVVDLKTPETKKESLLENVREEDIEENILNVIQVQEMPHNLLGEMPIDRTKNKRCVLHSIGHFCKCKGRNETYSYMIFI